MSTIHSDKAYFYPLRLLPDQDLKKELDLFCKKNNLSAAHIISAVGSLQKAHLRMANSTETKIFTGPLEILSLSGTLSVDGLHLHLSVSNNEGQCFGGHLLENCKIFTTVELLIISLPKIKYSRLHDIKTGYNELVITKDH